MTLREKLLTILILTAVIYPVICGTGVIIAKGYFDTVAKEITQKDFDSQLAEKGYIHIFFGICGKPLDKVSDGKQIPCGRVLGKAKFKEFVYSSIGSRHNKIVLPDSGILTEAK